MASLTEYPAELKSFDVWLVAHKPKHVELFEACAHCGERDAVTDVDLCMECARYTFGYDQARYAVASDVLEGAVRGAMVQLPPSEIVAIVQNAISAVQDEWVDATVDRLTRARSGAVA